MRIVHGCGLYAVAWPGLALESCGPQVDAGTERMDRGRFSVFGGSQ